MTAGGLAMPKHAIGTREEWFAARLCRTSKERNETGIWWRRRDEYGKR
jgi:hypothetical protein